MIQSAHRHSSKAPDVKPTKRYLLSDVDMGEEEAEAVADVVRGKWLSMGPRTAEFEKQFAAMVGVEHAVATSNCTAALHLSLAALDVGPGDEVIVPSYTFVATANAVLYCGATPIFADIAGADDLNLDIDDVATKITPRTKAIVVVHLAGFPADMDRLADLAEEHGVAVVEDACHAIGASYRGVSDSRFRGRRAGALGDVGCFSFFANKNMVTGEGGMLVTDDAEIARRARLGRSHGMTKSSWDKASGRAVGYDVEQLGYNYRSTELTAALGMIQLRKLPQGNARRKELVARYREQLSDVPGLSLPFVDRLDDSAHHIMPILLADAARRTAFRESLNEAGVQTSVHYQPVHLLTHYRDNFPQQRELSRTIDAAEREVTLPLHPLLEEDDVDAICAVVRRTATDG